MIRANLFIHQIFNHLQLFKGDRLWVGKVKPQVVLLYQRPFLAYMLTKNFA